MVDWNQQGRSYNLPLVKYLAYKSLCDNKAVYQVERLPNTYYPYPKPDIDQFETGDVVAVYMAEAEARRAHGFFQDHKGGWYHQLE